MIGKLVRMCAEHRLPVVDLDDFEPDRSLLGTVPLELAQEHQCFPLALAQNRLLLACLPDNVISVQDFISRVVGKEILPVLSTEEALRAAIQRHYLDEGFSGAKLGADALKSVKNHKRSDEADIPVNDAEAPVAALVAHILRQAVRFRASDIHLEPDEKEPKIRYRIDGALIAQPSIPLDVFPAVVSRIKILASLDIAERRRPQDGRAILKSDERSVELRVSVIPMLEGESVVIRLLGTDEGPVDVDSLNLTTLQRQEWMRLARLPHGIVLVTGPTGSGKTTTLYSTLRAIRRPEKKIITLEDPVESKIDGVSQIPIRSDIGFDFAKGLRSVLRHDPDVLLLGEIRDLETATIAVQASLTGHLLFATLHTNSAAQAITRLLDMGLAGYQVMTSLSGVLAQRLMRRLCVRCKKATDMDLRSLGLTSFAQKAAKLWEPQGCAECLGTGYLGRLAIFELLTINPKMRRLTEHDLQSENIESLAASDGFSKLSVAGEAALLSGATSLAEYLTLFGKEGT